MDGATSVETTEQRIKRILGPDGFDQVFRPIEEAGGLPNAAYWSQEWHELEQELILRRSWVFAGARAQMPQPGDLKPLEVGGLPIVLVHDRDGNIRGFQNVCRHLGMQLVTEPCKKTTLTCPYHK